ncbi:hypothetical protein BXZ70DRAFT_285390 [Cristinia sonorae]|uniref:DUF1793-domain-containing protein n=1 Tax=Cristinia sonorae TaxID=1940300 RepID=A0A8K0XV92_9AGAR|nr:hypothetical protein BXZ70DRAFT_285390 [Cristinia sonorae]
MVPGFIFACLLALATCPSFVASQNFPAWIPLVLRSPYHDAWTSSTAPMSNWPTFWSSAANNVQILGWVGYIKVDGTAYRWIGGENDSSNSSLAQLLDLEVTPTRTIMSMQAGQSVLFNVTMLSPIEESDPVKQSLPFSYVYLDVVASDDQPHEIAVYMDISAEWASGNRSQPVSWSSSNTDTSITLQYQLLSPVQFQETANQADDVTTFIAMRAGPSVSSTIALDQGARQGFVHGSIPPRRPESQGPIAFPFPVYAIVAELGSIAQTTQSIVWALGSVRNPVVQYTTGTGTIQNRAPYFMTKYGDIQDAVDAFLLDFDNSKAHAIELDNRISQDASSISPVYSNLVSLSARQAIGATELTVASGTDGKLNTSDVMMFMKNIGNPDGQRVNPVEIIYAAFPFFLYLNPTYAGYLLAPLFDYQASSQSTQPYAAKDLGTTYPKATGNNREHSQGIEQSGNMLIMTLAHARISGDGKFINQYYGLLEKWARYLVNNTMLPTSNQISADLESRANITNLVVKGIIGVRAMAEISKSLGKNDDVTAFSTAALQMSETWESLALSSDRSHILATYGDEESWALPYNLYADQLLQTNLINTTVYASETSYLKGLMSETPKSNLVTSFGLPISTTTTIQGHTAWTLFTAAIMSDPATRDMLLQPIWNQVVTNTSTFPYSDVYNLNSGALVSGSASPALGGIFAPLALRLSAKTIVAPPPSPGSDPQKSSIIGPVVGGVVGGLVLITLAIVAVIFWRRRRQQRISNDHGCPIVVDEMRVDPIVVYGLGQLQRGSSQPRYADMSMDSREISNATAVASETASRPNLPNPRSTKSREAGYRAPAGPPTASTAAYTTSNSGGGSSAPASSQEPPSTVASRSVVEGLRAEVEELRRAMLELHADSIMPPPSYTTDQH